MKEKIKTLTLNFWGLPQPFSKDLKKRLNQFIELLKKSDYDIICLQECWSKSHVRKLKTELKNYFVSTSKKSFLYNASGLVTLTKQKPISNEFVNYKVPRTLRVDEIVAKKGILITKIKICDEVFSILNTHTFSRNKIEHEKILFEQLEKLKQIALTQKSTIVLGDLNINNKEFFNFRNEKFSYCASKIPSLNKKNPYRKFAPIRFNNDGETVSHIFVKTNPIKSKIKTNSLDNVFVSDHQPVESVIDFEF